MDYNYTANVTLKPTNNSSATVDVLLYIEQDKILERNESFTMELVLPSNVTVNRTQVYIQDDDSELI